jgi:acyl carrier protein
MSPADLPVQLAYELQADPASVAMDTKLQDIPEYDSMGRLSVLAMLDGHYGVMVSAEELEACDTVRDLGTLIASKRPT